MRQLVPGTRVCGVMKVIGKSRAAGHDVVSVVEEDSLL